MGFSHPDLLLGSLSDSVPESHIPSLKLWTRLVWRIKFKPILFQRSLTLNKYQSGEPIELRSESDLDLLREEPNDDNIWILK